LKGLPSYVGFDLFAGAGGLSNGLSQAGFKMNLGIEKDPNAAKTLQENHKNMKVIVQDIRSVDPIETARFAGINKKNITLIAGGPPCRGFSQSNRRTRNLQNPLNSLYKEFFRFVSKLRPKFFFLENVQGLKTLNGGIVLQDIIETGTKLGYYVNWKIVNATDYGVPQCRKRLIFIGSPETFECFNFKKRNHVTVREAIDDLPILENGNCLFSLKYSKNMDDDLSEFQMEMRKHTTNEVKNNWVTRNNSLVLERYNFIPEGGNWTNIPEKLMYNYKNLVNCHKWIYHRLKWDSSSISISNFRKNMLIHPEQNRGLSVREAARLQTFPDNYVFHGPLGSQQQQVANAVPTCLAKEIGKRILSYLMEGSS